jgi:hypothetical protein
VGDGAVDEDQVRQEVLVIPPGDEFLLYGLPALENDEEDE